MFVGGETKACRNVVAVRHEVGPRILSSVLAASELGYGVATVREDVAVRARDDASFSNVSGETPCDQGSGIPRN